MNWDYISGFFDADGSVTLIQVHRQSRRTLTIYFSNNEKYILEQIRDFIEQDLGIKGVIILKKARKQTHQDSYELRYSYNRAYEVSLKLKSRHDKKIHRIKIYREMKKLTKRNGKYSEEELKQKEILEREFFNNKSK